MTRQGAAAVAAALLACASCGRGGPEGSGPSGAGGGPPPRKGGAEMAGERRWGFGEEKPGTLPAGFVVAQGEWKIVLDASTAGPKGVLAQQAKNFGSTFNLVLIDGTSYRDVDLSVRMKAVAGGEDQGGGLVWRAKDAKNYYIARFNPLEDNFRVYKVVEGRRSQLQSADVKNVPGWHALRIAMKGAEIRCFLDGRECLKVSDSTFSEAGRIGLWSKADAQSLFDDLTAAGTP